MRRICLKYNYISLCDISVFFCIDSGKKTGTAAVLHRDGRLVFYLITKRIYSDKPTYKSLESSLMVRVAISSICLIFFDQLFRAQNIYRIIQKS